MSVDSVVSRFGALVRRAYAPPKEAGLEVPFPFQLESVRSTFEHHLVPLIMVGRADHELLTAERDAIVGHCRATLRRHKDKLLTASEISALEDYVERFAPTSTQLDAALKKIEAGGQDELAELLAAVDSVILADDTVRPEEQKQLNEIKALLAKS